MSVVAVCCNVDVTLGYLPLHEVKKVVKYQRGTKGPGRKIKKQNRSLDLM